jgi:hypothetical protein
MGRLEAGAPSEKKRRGKERLKRSYWQSEGLAVSCAGRPSGARASRHEHGEVATSADKTPRAWGSRYERG